MVQAVLACLALEQLEVQARRIRIAPILLHRFPYTFAAGRIQFVHGWDELRVQRMASLHARYSNKRVILELCGTGFAFTDQFGEQPRAVGRSSSPFEVRSGAVDGTPRTTDRRPSEALSCPVTV